MNFHCVVVSVTATSNYKFFLRKHVDGTDSGDAITAYAPQGLNVYGTQTFEVKVITKTASHPQYGTGSASGYSIDGLESPFIVLVPGNTYKFDQSDSSNTGHPLAFYLEEDKTTSYTTSVTTNGTPGSSGAYTQIVVSTSTPQVLYYQCSSHAYMGSGSYTLSDAIADGKVGTAQLAANAVTSTKIAANSVDSSELVTGSIDTIHIGDLQVTSAKIADGTILNINVNTAAAIDGTKISPNFGAQNIITTGSVGGSTATFSGDVLQYTTLKTPYYLREPDFDAPTLTTQKSYNIPTWANRFVVNMDNGAVTGSNVVLLVQFGSATAWWNHTSTFVSNPSSAISVASWIAAQSPFATGSAVTTDGFALGLVGVAGYYSSSHTVFMKMLDRWSNSGTFQYEPTSNPTLTGRGTGKIFTNPVDFINTPTQIRIVGSAGGPIAGKFGVTWFSE